jgi:DNA polymerase I
MVDRSTGERLRFNDMPLVTRTAPSGPLKEGLRRLAEADEIAGHNVINFDIPAIQKVYPDFKPRGRVHDTLVYSRIIWTNIRDIDLRAIRRRRRPREFEEKNLAGRHSLEAWGYRLGDYKGDFAGPWDAFTADMDDYCAQDVEVTCKLIQKIEDEGYSSEALELETRVAQIIDLQEKHGFLFDVEAAQRLEVQLIAELADLEDKLRASFKPWFAPKREKGSAIKVPTKTRRMKTVYEPGGPVTYTIYTEGHPYSKVQLVSFEPGSRDKIADRLIKLFDWRPQEFTEGGKPKVDDTTLDGLDFPEAKLLKDYLLTSKRLGYLASGKKSLLKSVGEDGRIHGRVNSNGAVTGRMTHSDPNLNAPKVKKDKDGNILLGLRGGYGVEIRGCFIVPKGKKLVGVDAEGLELRKLGHYMARYDGGEYIKALVEGDKSKGTDVHSITARVLGYPGMRDGGKRWMYAYLYGAGVWKLGFIEYDKLMDEEQRAAFNRKYPAGEAREKALSQLGSRARARIESGLPALGALSKQVKETAAKNGYLRSLDGRKLHVRAQHSALNTLLQGGGAVVMKKALVLAYDEFLARGWVHGREFAFVANVHDEFQIEAEETLAAEIGKIAAEAIRQAGEAFGLRCPLAGSCDIGDRWSDTH